MTAPARRPLRRPNMRRAVILFPSGLTLGNLFFGVFAIIAASRLEFVTAGVYVMLGGICDALDGRVARATNAGTQFGEELDSLVDAITFGLAPGMIMYFAVLNRDGWDWVWVFLFAACAVMRLARFNIEQAGTAKTYFQGLPSPAAGITLASYYWFSQSWLYNYGAIADLKWHVLLRYLMVVLSFLMISNIPYPTFPRTGFRSVRAIGATLLVFGSIVLLATRKLEFFFPFALIYVAWGIVRWVFFGLFERRQPTVPYDLSEGEDDDDEEFELTDSRVHATRQGHRDERPARLDASRPRLDRAVSEETKHRTSAPRLAEKIERPARPERPERPARQSDADRSAERSARREKKKDRPKRPDRPDRAAAAQETASGTAPSLAPAPTIPTEALGVSPAGGVGAITLNPSPPELTLADEEELAPSGTDVNASASPDGAPARKRKRRRRRGERKERGAASEAGGETAAPQHTDSSPYAPAASSPSSAPSAAADLPPAAPPAALPDLPPDLEPSE
ncbi:MAG: CDP-diacylglycerol--serine O-phosphatidyltransferase [Gemmatimonadaceae bacterium]